MSLKSDLLDRLGVTPEQVNATPMFRGVGLSTIDEALRDCPVVRVEAGTVIIRAGQRLERMYLIIRGEADVRLGSPEAEPVASFRAGDIFGEFSVIDGQPASAYVCSSTSCTLLGLSREALWNLFRASPELANNLLTIVVSRVRDSNETIRALQARLNGEDPAASVLSDTDTVLDDPTASVLP